MSTPPRSPSPHAALFEEVFSQPEHAASELQLVLPRDLVSRLDWASLELQPGSFRDADLVAGHVDLLFSVRCEGRPAFVYVLFEHQSTTDVLMPFRLLRYMVRIWERFRRDNPAAERFPPIVPVVLHHSRGGWSGAEAFSDLLDVDFASRSALGRFVPDFRFVLDDISTASDADLRLRSALASAALFLLRDARHSADVLADLRKLFDVLCAMAEAPRGAAALGILLRYAFQVGEIPEADLQTFAHQLGPAAEEVFMTTAERIAERVRAEFNTTAQQIADEERAKGRAEGEAKLLVRLLERQFGSLPPEVPERLRGASVEQLELWGERLLSAKTLAEIFG